MANAQIRGLINRGKEGEEQNHYDWILENGTSKVIHYNGWSAETICNETEFTMPDGIRHVEMTASEDSFRITLNGITVHEHTLAPAQIWLKQPK